MIYFHFVILTHKIYIDLLIENNMLYNSIGEIQERGQKMDKEYESAIKEIDELLEKLEDKKKKEK